MMKNATRMSELRTYDIDQILHRWPSLPHLGNEVVCFMSRYDDIHHPLGERYFNRELILVLLLAGRSDIRLNGWAVPLETGTLLLHGPGYLTDHRYATPDIEFITLSLSASLWKEVPSLARTVSRVVASMSRDGDCTLRLDSAATGRLRRGLETLMTILESDHRFLRRRVQLLCETLVLDIADSVVRRTVVREHVSRRERLLHEFHTLALQHFREEHTVGFYADRLAVSRQYLTRVLRAETGRGVTDILSELLLAEARSLLLSTMLQVGEVAERLGFGDTAVFCKFFRRHVGCTPLAFRRQRGL